MASNRLFVIGVLLVVCFFFSNSAEAATWERQACNSFPSGICNAVGGSRGSLAAWSTDILAACNAHYGGGCSAASQPAPTEQALYWATAVTVNEPSGSGNVTVRWYKTTTPADCYSGAIDPQGYDCVDPVCNGSITGTAFLRPVLSADPNTGNICHESSQCRMEVNDITTLASGDTMTEYTGTNTACSDEPLTDVQPGDTQPNCITSGGDTWCTEPNLADQNCGYFNDDYVCLGSIPAGNCTFYGNGSMACVSGTGSPPAPDNGTPGVTATPDGSIESNGTIIDIFGSGTVQGSSGTTSGSSQNEPTETAEIDLDLSPLIETYIETDADTQIDAITGTMESDLDGVIAELSDPNDFASPTVASGTTIGTALGYSACADITIGGGAFPSATFTCAQTADLRAVLGWILRITLAMFAFNLVMTKPT